MNLRAALLVLMVTLGLSVQGVYRPIHNPSRHDDVAIVR